MTRTRSELATTPVLPAAPVPRRRRRVSEARAAWQAQLPAVHALAPWGHLRMGLLFKIIPTNPDSPRLDAAFCDWGTRSGLFESGTAKDVADTRMGYLVYWLAPTTSVPALWNVGIYNLWVIAVDDFIVERGGALEDLKRACDDVIRDGHSKVPLTAASRFFIELRQNVIGLGGAAMLPEVADNLQVTFQAWESEQRYIREDFLPSLPEYLKLRVRTPGLHGPLLVQRCEKGLLPPGRRFCERLARIADLVNVIMSLHSDVIGYRRDLEANYPMNIIAVISLDFSVDLATAYLMSLDLIELLKHMFDALVEDVCADPDAAPGSAAQARAMAVWPDGFHTWHQNSSRYGTADSPMEAPWTLRSVEDWRTGSLFSALFGPIRGDEAPRSAIGPTGLGTSAARLAASLDATKRLKDWAAGVLGWPARSDHVTRDEAGDAAPAERRRGGGIGLAASLEQIHRQWASGHDRPSAAAPGPGEPTRPHAPPAAASPDRVPAGLSTSAAALASSLQKGRSGSMP